MKKLINRIKNFSFIGRDGRRYYIDWKVVFILMIVFGGVGIVGTIQNHSDAYQDTTNCIKE